MKFDKVILVDDADRPVGITDKMEAHRKGLLHRAFSVFIFNPEGELLLQKRARGKYHSGGLWTNTCCSHPQPNKGLEESATLRLEQEMGFSTPLKKAFSFSYRTEFSPDMIEHEVDHVMTGTYDGEPRVDPREVSDWRFVSLDVVRNELLTHPESFTSWFETALNGLTQTSQTFS